MEYLLVTAGSTSILLSQPLTLKNAEWILGCFSKGVASHPLREVLPRRRFASMALATQSSTWLATFSQSSHPLYLEVRGRPVAICGEDRATFQVTLERVQKVTVDMSGSAGSFDPGDQAWPVVTPQIKSLKSTPRHSPRSKNGRQPASMIGSSVGS